jgi:hypothetical protein
MAVRKLSVALDEEVVQGGKRAARRAGVSLSSWLNHAAANELAIEAGLDAVREWEADHGRLTESELAEADAVLDRATDASGRARSETSQGAVIPPQAR